MKLPKYWLNALVFFLCTFTAIDAAAAGEPAWAVTNALLAALNGTVYIASLRRDAA